MAGTAILSIKILSDAKDARKGFEDTATSVGKIESAAGRAAAPAAGLLAGIGAAALGTGKMAATAEQNVGAVRSVFGDAADAALKYGENAATTAGLSASAYNEMSAITGTALKSAGVSADQLAAKNDALIQRGADMASVFGGTTADAVGAMGAAFRGEFDSLERYGLTLSAAAVEQELVRTGQDKLTGSALDAAKKQATLSLIMEQTSGVAGNFAKEAGTAAGAQERATAQYQNAAASLGESLLPLMVTFSTLLASAAGWAQQNESAVKIFAVGLAVLAGGVLLVNGAFKAYRAATVAATAAQWVLNTAMRANPIGLVITLLGALVAGVVWAWNNVDGFKAGVTAAWSAITTATAAFVGGVISWVTGAWNTVTAATLAFGAGVISWVTGTWNTVTAATLAFGVAVVGFISGAWNNATAATLAFGAAVLGFIVGAWNNAKAATLAFGVAVVGFISGAWRNVTAAVSAGMGAVRSFVASGWNAALGVTRGITSAVGNVVRGAFNMLGGFVSNGFSGAVRAVSAGIGGVGRVLGGIRSTVMGALSGAGSWLFSAGQNIVQGLINGVTGLAGRIGSFFLNAVPGWIRGPFQKALGIASPSKVFAQYGVNTGEGFILGTKRMQGRVAAAAKTMLRLPKVDLTMTGSAAAGGGDQARLGRNAGTVINVTVNGALDPVAVGEQLRRVLNNAGRRAGVIVNGETAW